jgi:hypothetical protein
MSVPTFTLNNGVEMLALGFGVYQTPPEELIAAVGVALEIGYRHIDTAAVYGNEREVGEAIRPSGLARDEVFLETKVWITDYGYDAALHAFDKAAGKLGVEHIDLLRASSNGAAHSGPLSVAPGPIRPRRAAPGGAPAPGTAGGRGRRTWAPSNVTAPWSRAPEQPQRLFQAVHPGPERRQLQAQRREFLGAPASACALHMLLKSAAPMSPTNSGIV